MKKIFFLIFLIACVSISIYSQNKNLTILCIAAHPDDEDGATLAYYSKLVGYNAYTIFYTRGEGGQNEIGPELYDELGKIREQECYQAAEIQGSNTYFLGCLDFGFSKTAKETFKLWGGKDSVLERIVYMIRKIHPDVVITNHDTITTKPNRQHGNHQAAGITIYEAFERAADPNYHSEQFVDGVTPWQIKKLFFRVFDSTKTDVIEIDVSQKDETGKTIREISADALAKHRTQGMDKIDKSNLFFFGNRKYELIRSDKMYSLEGNDLFAGISDNEPKPHFELSSFPTIYSYRKLNQKDSLEILNSFRSNYGVKVGLVKTYDNTLEEIFKTLQINYRLLDSLTLADSSLNIVNTIFLDIRTYLYRTDLIRVNDKLIKFVYDGGNVVSFYNKPSDWNNKNYSPYPIFLTTERVTDENAPVKVKYPWERIFSNPNLVNDSDWLGWVQERSIYLPSDDTTLTSLRYERFLSMQDEDDTVPPTSLLHAWYGKGSYTYCSLALYRQLKIFHKGALKLLINMTQPKMHIER